MRALLFAGTFVASAAFAETLSVEDAVQRALSQNPQVRAARERKEGADDTARSNRGQLLPSVNLSEEFLHYDSPFTRDLVVPGAPPGTPGFPLNIREQNTNTFAASLRQPLLGLLRLSQDYVSSLRNADAAGSVVENTERGIREAIESAYLRLYEARAAREVAKTSQDQLAEQLTVAQARVEAGALTTADVLRVQVAKANIQQQELQAGVAESASRLQLLTLIGMPLDADVDFVAPTALEAEAEKPAPDFGAAAQEATTHRADLQQQVHLLEGAEASARSRLYSLLPEIDFTAAYTRIDGQALAQPNAGYVGVRASWPIWLWGSQWYAHRSAVHQAESARMLTEDATRQVRAEVSGRLDQLRAATAAIDVAKTALSSAEEAFRVTAAVVQAGSGTTTDLLDAQSALTQAKLNLVRSRYQQALARVALRRAMGG